MYSQGDRGPPSSRRHSSMSISSNAATNPLFRKWTMKRFRATVMNSIWPEVLFLTLVALMVCLVSSFTDRKLVLPAQLLTVLGLVLGLVISFRTSSAYEKYQEGRKLWTTVMIISRNLAQQIWFNVPLERGEGKSGASVLEVTIEKKSMINIIQAVAVSIKHFLRNEKGVYYDDLYPLISFLPKYPAPPEKGELQDDLLPLWGTSEFYSSESGSEPLERVDSAVSEEVKPFQGTASRSTLRSDKEFDPEKALPFVECDRELKPARNPPKQSITNYFPVLIIFRWMWRVVARRRNTARRLRKNPVNLDTAESNIPLELTLFLGNYVSFLIQGSYVNPTVAGSMVGNVSSILETVGKLECTRNTPLPFAYQAHLRTSLWIYLFFFPFQLEDSYGWFSIPATAFAAFLLLGFLEIGQQIENPFGYDPNDLDMDGFCLSLQRDLHEIMTHVNLTPSDFMFGRMNQPFAPADRRSAEELLRAGKATYCPPGEQVAEEGFNPIRRTLVKSWYEVEDTTREFKLE